MNVMEEGRTGVVVPGCHEGEECSQGESELHFEWKRSLENFHDKR